MKLNGCSSQQQDPRHKIKLQSVQSSGFQRRGGQSFVHVCSSVRADIGIQELTVDVADVCAELEDPLE